MSKYHHECRTHSYFGVNVCPHCVQARAESLAMKIELEKDERIARESYYAMAWMRASAELHNLANGAD